ncbi:MAG: HDOD domain-containing protein, partial [Gammaproteobacteria bacterium]|nr:HDOD domain-containing protein [Gammaproteobacteria bacterium]
MDFSKPVSVSDFLEGIEDYIIFPSVGFEVNRMVADERYTAIDIANEIAKDPLIAAQVLRLANSIYYQFPSSIDSIPRESPLLV